MDEGMAQGVADASAFSADASAFSADASSFSAAQGVGTDEEGMAQGVADASASGCLSLRKMGEWSEPKKPSNLLTPEARMDDSCTSACMLSDTRQKSILMPRA
jgi:hypothetical protein